MSTRRLIILLCLSPLFGLPLPAHAELVVIVSAHNEVEHLSREEIINIFMGRYRRLPNGQTVIPLDIGGDTIERRDFYKKLLDKNLADINAYWARLTFSGRTAPPNAMKTQAEVLDAVAASHFAIGYIEKKNLDDRVKVIFTLPE